MCIRDSDFSLRTATTTTSDSDDHQLPRQQDRDDESHTHSDDDSQSHSDVEPLAQAGERVPGLVDHTDDSDYEPSNPLTSADEDTDNSEADEDTYQPV